MLIMKTHADLLREIDIIKEQITQLNMSLLFWMDSDSELVFVGKGPATYGLSVSAQNVDRIHKKLNALQLMLEAFEAARDASEERIGKLSGIAYQIARLRYVEGKTLEEIADELGYSHAHIRRISARSTRLESSFV